MKEPCNLIRRGNKMSLLPKCAIEHFDLPAHRNAPHSEARTAALRELGEFLKWQGINHVAGPVLSGALIAHEIATAVSDIVPHFIPKGGYHPRCHGSYHRVHESRWVLVDDILATGDTVRECCQVMSECQNPDALIFFSLNYHSIPNLGRWEEIPVLFLVGA